MVPSVKCRNISNGCSFVCAIVLIHLHIYLYLYRESDLKQSGDLNEALAH